MTTRPERRKSSLSGESPVAPVREAPGIEPAGRASRTAAADVAAGAAGERRPRRYPPKVSFYLDGADQARLRAAYRHTLAHSSDRSLTDFLGRVVMAEVTRLEGVYNGGQPFPSVAAGELPQGRPLGE